jgi:hypothetical protein
MVSDGTRLINTGTQALSGAGTIDMSNNDMIVRSGDIGAWNGSAYGGITGLVTSGKIITSQSRAQAGRGRTTLAVALRSDATGWAGESAASTAIIIKYTYVGDADFDGVVDGDDFFAIDSGFPSGSGYHAGDFDYTGGIDADDYFWISENYAFHGSAL